MTDEMTDAYTPRERALLFAREDAESQWTSVEEIIEVAEKYLAFLMPPGRLAAEASLGEFITQDSINIWKRTNNVLAQLQDGGIAG